jgi:poly(A) polymerase
MKLDPARHAWMRSPACRKVMAALENNARFVGGAVRNALMGQPVDDIDIATPLPPDRVTAKLTAAGVKAVPTGISHGTVTAVADGKPFEITTLRRDVRSFGRHAEVVFTDDWREDAQRRDFTINALYADQAGEIFDFVGGLEDLPARRVRFVGEPDRRIAEDYLRILRLFRFHVWYGGGPLDRAALAAAAAGRAGLRQLSGERIAKEMLKLLAASSPAFALGAMAEAGILSEIGLAAPVLDRLERLALIDRTHGFLPDPLLRLASLRPDAAVAERWRLSNAQKDRLAAASKAAGIVAPSLPHGEARKLLYRLGVQTFNDRLFLNWAGDADPGHDGAWCALLEIADFFASPRFPLTGRDAMDAGVPEGPQVGKVLAEVEEWWIESGFPADAFALRERLKRAARDAVKK